MGRRMRKELPVGVRELRERIERWRRARERRGPMPAELWEEAVRLARSGRAFMVARGAGIDFQSLRRRVAESAASGGRTSGSTTSDGFVELSGAQLLGAVATGQVVEMADRNGVRVTIRLGAAEKVDVTAIVQGFCSRRR